MPEISVRIDPFNWLLEGRLGLELESQVYKFVSLEVVPEFVTSHSPPFLNYDTYSSVLSQSSNGAGAISGVAIDAAFWFDGKPFRGTALRTGFTNYAYTYNSSDSGIAIDSVSHTEREFFAMLAESSRWGAFTLAYGFGLGYELNQQNRCFTDLGAETSSCPKNQLLIKNSINRYLINSPMLSGLKKNPDGSLSLYIQKDSPGPAKEANWLPAPNDTIYLVMRLYWPKETPPSILPAGEGTWKPPAVVASR